MKPSARCSVATSPTTSGRQSPASSGRARVLAMISGPVPAASPMVMARSGGSLSGMRGRMDGQSLRLRWRLSGSGQG